MPKIAFKMRPPAGKRDNQTNWKCPDRVRADNRCWSSFSNLRSDGWIKFNTPDLPAPGIGRGFFGIVGSGLFRFSVCHEAKVSLTRFREGEEKDSLPIFSMCFPPWEHPPPHPAVETPYRQTHSRRPHRPVCSCALRGSHRSALSFPLPAWQGPVVVPQPEAP